MDSNDFILVVEGLLNEIRPLKEQIEMMADEPRPSNEEFRKAQLKAIKERTQQIDSLLSQLDSIVEADEADSPPDAASSGGRRKTKRRRNKKKRKTKKKRRRRRKK